MNSIKKSVSILLCILLILALMMPAFAAEDNFKFSVATDIHIKPIFTFEDVSKIQNLPESELYYHATNQGLMYYESEAILRSFLDQFVKSDSKVLLLCGDMSTGPLKSNNQFIADILREYENKGGKPIYVINGNHDVDAVSTDENMDIDDFKNIYADFGYNDALAVDKDSGSYTADLYGNYRLLAIDSCKHGDGDGLITKGVQSFVKEQAAKAKEDGKYLVAMMHHPLMKHFALEPATEVEGSTVDAFASKLASYGVKYLFCGHMHINDIVSKTTVNGKLTNVMTESLITSPNSYRTVTATPEKFEIKTNYVTSIDTDDLAPGYTDAQLALINSDYPAYSKGYFDASYRYWINHNLGDPYVLNKTLKLDTQSDAYKALDGVMTDIGTNVNMPLYSNDTPETDTVEELADKIGIAIPESGYNYFYELLDDVVRDFYAGTEDPEGKSTELSLLLPVAKTLLYYAVDYLITNGERSEIRQLLDSLKTAGILSPLTNTVKLANSTADTITLALISPLLDGITNDYCEPDDVEYTGEGYGTESQTSKAANFFEMLKEFFKKILMILQAPIRAIG